jgi:hypothetical protein
MKTFIFTAFALLLSASLFGCNHAEDEVQNNEQKRDLNRNMIIVDSVNEPLPPEANNVQSLPSKKEPQQIPNANLNEPIVITKMPYSETKRP